MEKDTDRLQKKLQKGDKKQQKIAKQMAQKSKRHQKPFTK